MHIRIVISILYLPIYIHIYIYVFHAFRFVCFYTCVAVPQSSPLRQFFLRLPPSFVSRCAPPAPAQRVTGAPKSFGSQPGLEVRNARAVGGAP